MSVLDSDEVGDDSVSEDSLLLFSSADASGNTAGDNLKLPLLLAVCCSLV